MNGFLTAGENLPFTIALVVMLGIALLEGVAMLLGAGISNFLDGLLPDVDLHVDGPDLDATSSLSRLLGWLRVGQVPVLMLLVVFLTAFGLIGLGVQAVFHNALGSLLPGVLASVPAFALALPVVRTFGGILGRIMPKDETDAVPEHSFIGRVAVITLGTATIGSPAEARLKGIRGQTHYIMVEPDVAGERFERGAAVVLVAQHGAVFRAIRNTSDALVDS